MQDYGYYGPGSATWKIASEALISLCGTRAVLMQIAHPLVATAVCEHSSYLREPLARTERTFILGQLITFGNTPTSKRAARTINQLHQHVHGTLQQKAGAFEEGTTYQARDPALLLWVHATLIESILLSYPLFIGPLSSDEQEQYYQESKTLARMLGLSAKDMPATVHDLRCYVNEMVPSNQLVATPQSRQLAQQILFPRVPLALRPFLHLNYQVTCALLPPRIRDMFDMRWSVRKQKVFDLSMHAMRLIVPLLPGTVRVLPITQQLMCQGALRKR